MGFEVCLVHFSIWRKPYINDRNGKCIVFIFFRVNVCAKISQSFPIAMVTRLLRFGFWAVGTMVSSQQEPWADDGCATEV